MSDCCSYGCKIDPLCDVLCYVLLINYHSKNILAKFLIGQTCDIAHTRRHYNLVFCCFDFAIFASVQFKS